MTPQGKPVQWPVMRPIEPPDTHYLRAAAGWLELNCTEDALRELEGISKQHQSHPDVLELRWLIHAERKDWTAALDVGTQLVKQAPERPTGWLHRAYAVRRASEGGLQEAWDTLLTAFEKFPREMTIPYNLSCYACQMGHLDESRKWLRRALRIGKKEHVKKMALTDVDLQPLWDEIRNL